MPAHPDEDRIRGYEDIHEVLTGGSRREPKQLEPIPVETYKCPVCQQKLECSLEEARAHMDQPVDDGLPLGLIYSDIRFKGSKVKDFHIIVSPPGTELDLSHGCLQFGYEFYSREPGKIDDHRGVFMKVSSKDIKDSLRKGDYRLVTLEDLRKQFGDDLKPLEEHFANYVLRIKLSDLKDPTPELEAIARGEQ